MNEFDDLSAAAHDPQPALPAGLVRRFRSQSQQDFEIQFFEGILERNPNYLDVLRVIANNLAARGEHARVLDIDRRIALLRPADHVAQYNLACSFSLMGLVDSGLSALQKAIECGYDQFRHLREDRDLDLLRKDPRFDQLLASYGIA